jgi:mannose-6-phosphate isomerase-like protein (cupin superfamily)
MEKEGVPVYEAMGGVDDLSALPRRPWARMGGQGTFIVLRGPEEAGKGLYVAEIPPGGALNPERHLYDETVFILRGRGLTEVWQEGMPKRTFEWGEGSLFAPPLNTWHRLVNGTREPVLILAETSAPWMLNTFHDVDFIFNCSHRFLDRFAGQPDFFAPADKPVRQGRYSSVYYTNFIPDVRAAFLDNLEQKVSGGQLTAYEMGGGHYSHGHMSEWPVGRYHKAHYHGPGAVLVGLRGEGFVMLWPRELGSTPTRTATQTRWWSSTGGPGASTLPPPSGSTSTSTRGRSQRVTWPCGGVPPPPAIG